MNQHVKTIHESAAEISRNASRLVTDDLCNGGHLDADERTTCLMELRHDFEDGLKAVIALEGELE